MGLYLEITEDQLKVSLTGDTGFGVDSYGISLEELKSSLGIKPSVGETYRAYKDWWCENQAGGYVGTHWGDTEEQCFSKHMSTLSLEELMEILDGQQM